MRINRDKVCSYSFQSKFANTIVSFNHRLPSHERIPTTRSDDLGVAREEEFVEEGVDIGSMFNLDRIAFFQFAALVADQRNFDASVFIVVDVTPIYPA